MPHRALIHVHMQVTDVKYSKAIEQWRQLFEPDLIARDENAFRIAAPAPVKAGQLQHGPNDRMDRIPVFYVKEIDALTENLRFMVRFDSQSLPRVQPSETSLQFQQEFFVHKELPWKSFQSSARASVQLA